MIKYEGYSDQSTKGKLSPAESNYSVHELELLAIVTCLDKWRCYLEGSKFTVRFDHASLALACQEECSVG